MWIFRRAFGFRPKFIGSLAAISASNDGPRNDFWLVLVALKIDMARDDGYSTLFIFLLNAFLRIFVSRFFFFFGSHPVLFSEWQNAIIFFGKDLFGKEDRILIRWKTRRKITKKIYLNAILFDCGRFLLYLCSQRRTKDQKIKIAQIYGISKFISAQFS